MVSPPEIANIRKDGLFRRLKSSIVVRIRRTLSGHR